MPSAENLLDDRDQLLTFGVTEPFTTTLTVSVYGALVLSLPVLLWQLYAYVLPAFSEAERRVVLPILLLFPVLFLTGIAFAYFVVMPAAVNFLLDFNDDQFNIALGNLVVMGDDQSPYAGWVIGAWASERIRAGIEASLAHLGVSFDVWTTEGSIRTRSALPSAIRTAAWRSTGATSTSSPSRGEVPDSMRLRSRIWSTTTTARRTAAPIFRSCRTRRASAR